MTNWSMVFDGTSLWHSSNDFIRDKIKFVVYIICNDIWCDSTNIKNIIISWFWVKTQWNRRHKRRTKKNPCHYFERRFENVWFYTAIIIMHVCVWQRNFASFKLNKIKREILSSGTISTYHNKNNTKLIISNWYV